MYYNAIELNHCTFSWHTAPKDKPEQNKETNLKIKEELKDPLIEEKEELPIKILALERLNLKIPKGQFVFIIGKIGSGKSSLLQAIMGEMHPEFVQDSLIQNQIAKNGEFAYVEQNPWIKNCTIKDNIPEKSTEQLKYLWSSDSKTPRITLTFTVIFTADYSEEKYHNVIKICELQEDLRILPHKDLTEIGERGINLSGGQKARVSLARALYSNRDIFLLDDPLSALDSNVKHKIFYNYIKKELRGKTILLASHCIEFLSEADRILALDHGKLVFDGNYAQLTSNPEYVSLLEKINCSTISEEQKEETKNTKISNKEENTKQIDKKDGKIIDEEESELGRVSFSVYKRYITSLGGKKFIILLSIVMVGWTFSNICADYWLGLWANHTSEHSKGYYLLIANTVFALLSVLCIIMQRVIDVGIVKVILIFFGSLKASKVLHHKMLDRLMHAPVNLFFDKTPVGRIINRFSNDLNQVDIELPFIIGNFLMSIAYLLGCFIISVLLIYWCIVPIPFVLAACYYYFIYYIRVQRKLQRLQKITLSPLLQFATESATGATTIRSFGKQPQFIKHCYELLDEFFKTSAHICALECWMNLRMQIISIIMNILTVLFVILKNDYWNQAMVGLALSYMLNLEESISGLLYDICTLETRMVATERCFEYTGIIQEAEAITERDEKSWPERGAIEFEDYSLRYRPDTELVLKQLNIQIKPQEKIGIVGRTGSGKSTLCLALLRIIEADSGRIKIDGRIISDIGLQKLRSSITIIPQDSTLFAGTLKFNLDPLQECSQEEILCACVKAKLDQILKFKGELLEMKIEESGKNLSSGERQLICIVRAMLRKNRIMLLDEATASMDLKTEDTIRHIISEDFSESTLLIVAHRIATVMNCDRILVLDNGKVAEFENPSILLKNLADIQKREEKQVITKKRIQGYLIEELKKNNLEVKKYTTKQSQTLQKNRVFPSVKLNTEQYTKQVQIASILSFEEILLFLTQKGGNQKDCKKIKEYLFII